MDQLKKLAELISKGIFNAGKATVGTAGAAGAGIGYALSGDNEEYKKNQAKKYTEAANMAREALKEFGFDDTKKTDLSKGQIGSFNPGEYAKNTTGAAADAAGFMTGTGAGAKTLLGKAGQRLAANALIGSAQAVDDSDSVGDFATKALSNTVLSSGGELAGKGIKELSKIPSKVFNSVTSDIGKKAQMSVAKATPEQFMKAVKEHGIDINEMVKKYYPKGATYDDVLGDISDRSGGGFLQKTLSQAEDKIQKQVGMAGSTMRIPVDDIVTELNNEIKLLKKVPGNEKNIAALQKFSKDTEKIYKNGVTAKQALAVKRAADSKFGKSVTDEDTGSSIVQGQKMLANYFRSKLKQTFPEVADALDTQSEILTLKPLLEKSRAISNTKGSEIRAGKLANVQLFNPLSWGNAADVALENPQVASKYMDVGDMKLPVPELNMAPKTGQLAGLGVSNLLTNNPEEQVNTSPEQGGQDPNSAEDKNNSSNQSGVLNANTPNNTPPGTLPATPNPDELVTITNDKTGETKQVKRSELTQFGIQDAPTAQTQTQGGLPFTSEQLMQGIIKAQIAGDTGAQKELGKMLEVVSSYEKMQTTKQAAEAKANKPKELTDKQTMFSVASSNAADALKLLDEGNVQTGKLQSVKGGFQKFTGSQSDKQTEFEANLAGATTAVISALSGANVPPSEFQRMVNSIPQTSDEPKIAKQKLKTFIEMSKKYTDADITTMQPASSMDQPVNFGQLQSGY